MNTTIFRDLDASLFNFPKKAVIASIRWQQTASPLTTKVLRRRDYFITVRVAEPKEALDVSLFSIDGKPNYHTKAAAAFLKPASAKLWHIFTKEEILDFVNDVNDENPIHRTDHPVVPGCLTVKLLHDGPCRGMSSIHVRFHEPCFAGEEVYLAPGAKDNTLNGMTKDRLLFTAAYKQ
jgi:hypothetical protein